MTALRAPVVFALALTVMGCVGPRTPDSMRDPANQPITEDTRLLSRSAENPPSSTLVSGLPGVLGDPATSTAGGRVPVDPTVWPWSAVGQLTFPSQRTCTGTLVGPQQVLTSAFCVFGGSGNALFPPQSITFTTGLRNADYVARSRARQVIVAPGYRRLARRDDGVAVTNFAENWAIVVLEDAIPVPPIAWEAMTPQEIAALTPVGTVTLVGYVGDRPHILSGDFHCPLTGTVGEPGLLLNACDARVGDGGSPLLYENQGEWRVLAATSGGSSSGRAPGSAVRPDINASGQIYTPRENPLAVFNF